VDLRELEPCLVYARILPYIVCFSGCTTYCASSSLSAWWCPNTARPPYVQLCDALHPNSLTSAQHGTAVLPVAVVNHLCCKDIHQSGIKENITQPFSCLSEKLIPWHTRHADCPTSPAPEPWYGMVPLGTWTLVCSANCPAQCIAGRAYLLAEVLVNIKCCSLLTFVYLSLTLGRNHCLLVLSKAVCSVKHLLERQCVARK